jgi:molybdenum cofactor cytidylyltransferase
MTQPHTHNYGLIILAADKRSLQPDYSKYHHKSSLQHAVDEANAATNNKVMVVTGYDRDILEIELSQLPVHVIYNEQWQQGISSSISCGISSLNKIFPYLYGIIISTYDQPFISAALFKNLIEKYQKGNKGIIASYSNNAMDLPVLFGKKYFNALLELKGKEAPNTLLSLYTDDVELLGLNKAV